MLFAVTSPAYNGCLFRASKNLVSWRLWHNLGKPLESLHIRGLGIGSRVFVSGRNLGLQLEGWDGKCRERGFPPYQSCNQRPAKANRQNRRCRWCSRWRQSLSTTLAPNWRVVQTTQRRDALRLLLADHDFQLSDHVHCLFKMRLSRFIAARFNQL